MKRVLMVLVLLSLAGGVYAKATHTIQITDDGRSMNGAFSPDGSQVAYLTLGKHFTPEGMYYFTSRLCLWDGERSRTVTTLPDSKPVAWEDASCIGLPFPAPHWLPSGDYVLVGKTLIRVADGATTHVGKHKGWFVMNDAWELPKADALALNRRVQGHFGPRIWRRAGESIRLEDLPACVPRESEDWEYGKFWRSPTNPDQALYIGFDKHFGGCCCTMGRQKRYLGVVNLRTGRRRRLTLGETYTINRSMARWSPDGSVIAYLRQSFHDVDTPIWWSTLHVIHPDGTSDQRLAKDVSHYFWVSPTHLVAVIGLAPAPGYQLRPQQLSIVDLDTGQVRRITKGYFHHELCDVDGDRYLVQERPVEGSRCQGNLYVIRPL